MVDAYAVAGPGDAPAEIARRLGETGCVLLRQCIGKAAFSAVSEFVYEELDRFRKVFSEHFGFAWGDTRRLDELLGEKRDGGSPYDALSPELKHLVRGELPLSVRIAPQLKAVAHEPVLMEAVRAILRDPVVRMHNPPSVRASFPQAHSAMVPTHQDASYVWHLSEFVTVWTPLCAIDAECGGIEILPRSHELAPIAQQPSAIWLEAPSGYDNAQMVPIHCEPGDAILFGPRLMHRSCANRSQRVRCSIDYRFFSQRIQSPKHFYDIEARAVRAPAVAEPAQVH